MTSRAVTPFIALILLALTPAALADGFIIIERPNPRVHVVPLAIKHHHVNVEIEGQVAVTTVDQVFYNPNNMQLEGTYIFPIPKEAGIENLSLWINGVEQKAELLDADKARNIYEGIVRRMKDPALLEYVGRRAFKLRVFPIPPRGERRVKLSYREVLPADGGLARYLYPLNTEKFSSQPLESVLVDVKLSSDKPLGNVMVLSHKAEVKREDDHHARITYEAKNVTPDRDFLVHFAATTKDFGLDVVAHREGSDDGYALIALSPRQAIDEAKIQKKDVVLVVDTSGSMAGARFKQAVEALRFCVNTLRDGDRFEIIPFSTEARPMFGELTEVTAESRKDALARIDKLEPMGGTNIDEALRIAQERNARGDRPHMVLFLTDGLPTIGETTEIETILKRAGERGHSNQRIFAFGVGNDVNTELLDRLSGENRGTRTYVGEEQDIEINVSSLWKKVASPVLTDVTLTTAGGAKLVDTYPRSLPDLFHGVQLLVTSRYTGSGPTAIRLTGKVGGESKEYVYECTFPAAEGDNEYLPRLWAVRKVGYLLDEINIHGESKELKDEVVHLSKKHGIMTPYTSYLVIEDERPTAVRRDRRALEELQRQGFLGDDRAEDARREAFRRSANRLGRLAHGDPAEPGSGGRAGEGRGRNGTPNPAAPLAEADAEELALDELLESKDGASAGLKLKTGEEAIRASRFIERLKGTTAAQDTATTFAGRLLGDIRHVDGRTFYHQGKGWVQAEVYDLEGEPEIVKVTAFSDEYFDLLGANPDLGKVLAIGDAVCFLEGGKVYLVVSE